MTRDQIKKIKRLPTRQFEGFIMQLYREAFIDGLKEAEKEFGDAVILTEDEAREIMPEGIVDKILEGIG